MTILFGFPTYDRRYMNPMAVSMYSPKKNRESIVGNKIKWAAIYIDEAMNK